MGTPSKNGGAVKESWTRRRFLIAAGAVGAVYGSPWRWSWTAEAPAPRLKIAFFTDVHTRTEWDTPKALEMAAAAINAEKPDLVIAGGDLITDGFESNEEKVRPRWNVYLERLHQRLDAPVHAAIGNHDLVGVMPEDGSPPTKDPRQSFLEHLQLDRTWRSVDFGGVHFIFLDAIQIGGPEFPYEGYVDANQLAWLSKQLQARGPDAPCIVVTHMPLLTCFYQATQGGCSAAPANRIIRNAHEVLRIFEGYNVLAVLQGHLHVNELLRWRNITFITGGAVCGKWWRGEWHGTREGFGVVTLEGHHVEWRYIEYGWQAQRPAGV